MYWLIVYGALVLAGLFSCLIHDQWADRHRLQQHDVAVGLEKSGRDSQSHRR